MSRNPQLLAIAMVAVFLGSIVGCSGDDSLRGHGTKKKAADEPAAIAEEESSQGNYTKMIDNSGANFQVKDMALLRSSIESCMGSDLLKVSAEMLLPTLAGGTDPALPDDKVRFLLPGQYAAGDDILEKERGNMVDTAAGARTGTAADGLLDTYLRSLEAVANVVAHNCSLDNVNCKCGDKDQAAQLLHRCLPGLDPETVEMDAAAETLGQVCADGAKGMRTAIASLLSSYAFASAR